MVSAFWKSCQRKQFSGTARILSELSKFCKPCISGAILDSGKIVQIYRCAPPPTELAPYACVSWVSTAHFTCFLQKWTQHLLGPNIITVTSAEDFLFIKTVLWKVCEICVHQMRILQNKTMADRRKYQFDIIWMHTLNVRRCLNSFQFRVQTLADYPSN